MSRAAARRLAPLAFAIASALPRPAEAAEAPRWTTFGEFLYWKPTDGMPPYAAKSNFANRVGPDVSDAPGLSPGLRTGFGFKPAGWPADFSASYTHWEARSRSSVEAPPGDRVDVLLQPGVGSANSISATHEFDYRVVDLEAGRGFHDAQNGFRVSGGLRFVRLRRDLKTVNFGNSFPISGARLELKTSYKGLGPRLGIAYSPLIAGHLRVLSGLGLSVIPGIQEASAFKDTPAEASRRVDKTVLGIDGRMGLGIEGAVSKSLTASFGLTFDFQHWGGIADPVFTGRGTEATGKSSDLILDGLSCRASLRW